MRLRSFHTPSVYVFFEFVFVIILVYFIWDYIEPDFGESFYLWLAIKDTAFVILLISLFRKKTIALLVVFYSAAAFMNLRFFYNESWYAGLTNADKIQNYDHYLFVYNQYWKTSNAIVAGQILGLIIHDAGGAINRFWRILPDIPPYIHKLAGYYRKITKRLFRVEEE